MLRRLWIAVCLAAGLVSTGALAAPINFESPHVHPLDMSPDASVLAACNTADSRVELFDLGGGLPVPLQSIAVGLDPVSVRFASNTTLLVVNHVSDSVSVIDLSQGTVARTIAVPDEPCDVVVAGPAGRAFVSCSQVNQIVVIDYVTGSVTNTVPVFGEDPRAMAVSADGTKVYAAVFESGNKSTILGGGAEDLSVIDFPPNVASDGSGPHAGANPAFNDGGMFAPPKNPVNGTPPPVGMIVKQDGAGDWRDDTGADWSHLVDGASAALSGRPVGWHLPDHDVAVIDAATLTLSYVDSLMNINMAMAVNPASGDITVVGTDAINEMRFEPNVNGIFVRVMMATADEASLLSRVDLNEAHLAAAQFAQDGVNDAYHDPEVPQADRDKSLGDPRGIAWNASGTRAYISGMGSNNLIVVNAAGTRVSSAASIELREGPTGVVVDDLRGQVYVLNRFDASVSTIDEGSEIEVENVAFFDPTPEAVKLGRKHLYDTHKTSGLGQASCAACHVDARFDRLAWDLGDPTIPQKPANDIGVSGDLNLGFNFPGLGSGFENFHPMKGPMTTQTLIGIIGHEPFHWRGDRLGLEEFNPAFEGLLGDDTQLTPQEMEEFKDFLASIHFPPNPYRNLDNTLPTSLPLPGHYATGDNDLTEGAPLPNGNAVNGLFLYRGAPDGTGQPTRKLDQNAFTCMNCHTLPTGDGPNARFNGATFDPIPADPITGNKHIGLVDVDGSTNHVIKVPHLQPLYDKVGFSMVNRSGDVSSLSGFGLLHDGSVDSIERFFAQGGPTTGAFRFANDQEVADMVALMLAFSGSDFDESIPVAPEHNPPGEGSPDVPASVGKQVSLAGAGPHSSALLDSLLAMVDASTRLELVAMGTLDGAPRGFLYSTGGFYDPDLNGGSSLTHAALLASIGSGDSLTFMVVPAGTGEQLALDRDGDGYLNHTEELDGSDPTDAASFGPQASEMPVGGAAGLAVLITMLAAAGMGRRKKRYTAGAV